MYSIYQAPFIKDMSQMTQNLWLKGWAESNGGNISQLLEEKEVSCYLDINKYLRTTPLNFDASEIAGKYFLVSGSGKHFRKVMAEPSDTLCIIKISDDGSSYHLLWGLENGGNPTSELASHLKCHIVRLQQDPAHRVILHTHATAVIAMTFIHDLDEAQFTKSLWKMITECLIVFPDGVSIVPWMVAGTNELGEASAEKMKDSRIVVWAHHGIMGAGTSLDDAFGLVEVVDKAARIYMQMAHFPGGIKQAITDEQLIELVKGFGVIPKKGILDLTLFP
ncbi:rhamnulose-1-phosphate aldolase [Brevibacillus laterosporus]|uniref:rhamnulose-1-phosphate aldolase n=1 Tax=Brevibacillus laterosporus TaxID=1465 RepID=UPI001125DCF1|nr:rhamnulose-1-phosphate aldolase [Brevibacillus laterosporus]MED2006245.1 rhamnulose-1-phosphate aldolase [Brevibacillus laterosporus]MED4766232.1 rhamnulose-1-phosphate aldolase [Brevibacillus laterosporus]TPH19050.1 rhamnulose-1-phosphate aldolase [Brevibacillus laterosporus]